MQREYNVDVAIIGAGTSGMTAYKILKNAGLSVLLIEKGLFGTTCARVGCMPSKLLISAAERMHDLKSSYNFGFESMIKPDIDRIFERVRSERDRFVKFTTDYVDTIPKNEILKKVVYFDDDGVLSTFSGIKIHAKFHLVATGSQPIIPTLFNPTSAKASAQDKFIYQGSLFTNETIFDRIFRAGEHIGVAGAGVIGLELGQAFDELGLNTFIFGKNNQIANLTDPDVSKYAKELFKNKLQNFVPNSEIMKYKSRLESSGEYINWVYYKDLDVHKPVPKNETVDTSEDPDAVLGTRIFLDIMLIAAGRQPSVKVLKLQNAGVGLTDELPNFDAETMFCLNEDNEPINVLIAGDCTGQRPLLHDAADEGRTAAENIIRALNNEPIQKRYMPPPVTITFTNPGIATVGYSYETLKSNLDNVKIGVASFEDQGRSRILHKNSGLIKVYADKDSDLFLGAEMICPDAEHFAHTLSWALGTGMTVGQMLHLPFYHPTTFEGVRTALRDCS